MPEDVPTATKRLRVPSLPRTRISLGPKHGTPDRENNTEVREWLNTLPKPWAVDIFAGAGGLSRGLTDAGFSIVAAADSDATALETHAHNIGGLTWHGDLTDPTPFLSQLSAWGIDQVDLVAGGPPCQPFSRAGTPKISDLVKTGNREAKDDRSTLWRSFLEVIDQLNAKAVLVENVPDFARLQSGATLIALLSELESRGYQTHVNVLDSWQYKVPQNRSRLFIVGLREGTELEWPSPNTYKPTLQQAIGDLPVVGPGQRKEEIPYTGQSSTKFSRRMRQELNGAEKDIIHDHITRFVREDDAIIFSGMKPGQTYKDVPEEMRRYRSDIFNDKYYRLTWDGLSRTITAHISKDGYWYIHPSEDRTLSIREAARIQTFPDSFRFAGYPTSRYKQIGNAVPPFLAEAVGASIHKSITASEVKEPSSVYSITSIGDQLRKWHIDNDRAFGWRRQRDPWTTLLAEVCLHRTRAEQVADIFPSLCKLAPSPGALLKNEKKARSLLSHLGLNWRIDTLFNLTDNLIEKYEGAVPDSYHELIRLPGVGDYVASAVLCFAYDQPATLIDTNTNRITRRFIGQDKMSPWELRLAMYQQMAKPGQPDAEFNYSLIDLGASVCKPHRPKCEVCPIKYQCATGQTKESYQVRM